MKQKNYLLIGLLITLGVLASCQKNTSSNADQSALGFQIQAINKTFPVGTVLDHSGNVTKDAVLSAAHNTGTFAFDTAVMNVSRIKFVAEEHKINSHRDSIEVTIEWSGPKTVDLFNMNDLIGQINLVQANYDRISVMMQSVRGDFGTSPVFYLAGTYTNDSAKVTPIRIIIDESISFSAEQSGAALDSASNWLNLVQVNLSLVMSHVRQANLDAATLTNGVIVVSSTSNTALYRNIRFDFDRARYCRFMRWHR